MPHPAGHPQESPTNTRQFCFKKKRITCSREKCSVNRVPGSRRPIERPTKFIRNPRCQRWFHSREVFHFCRIFTWTFILFFIISFFFGLHQSQASTPRTVAPLSCSNLLSAATILSGTVFPTTSRSRALNSNIIPSSNGY